jgi:2-keto-4-pentenoate hydratase
MLLTKPPQEVYMRDSITQEFASTFLELFDAGRLKQEHLIPIQSLTPEQAYQVQDSVIQQRVARGERIAGYKVGCTSRAIREQFGLSEPICGRLMEPHLYYGETNLKWSDFTQCAVEPEFVLHIGKDVKDHRIDDKQLLDAIDYVSPGIEVHNYKFWFGNPSSQELIASNGLHACLVVGEEKVKANKIDLAMEKAALLVDTQLVAFAGGHEIMGGPLESLRCLIKHLTNRGDYLRAGQLVIPGSPVRLVMIRGGECVHANLGRVGSVRACFD